MVTATNEEIVQKAKELDYILIVTDAFSLLWRHLSPRMVPLLTGIVLVLILVLTPSAPEAKEPERIIIAGGDKYEPLVFINTEGEPDGLYIDRWKLWSQKTGIEVELRLMDWADTIPALVAGEVDVVGGITYTTERAQFLDFSEPYTETPAYIYFHESLGGVRGLADLEGFPVGVLGGGHIEEYVRKEAPNLRPIPYVNYEEIVKAAIQGRLRVFVGEDPVIPFLFAKMGHRIDFRRTKELNIHSDIRSAVRKGETDLLALIELGNKAITPAEWNNIRDQWAGVSLAARIPWRWLIGGVAILLIGISLLLLWNTQLKKRVAMATETLSKSEERLRSFGNALPDLAFIMDEDGRYLEILTAQEHLLYRDVSDVKNRIIHDVLPKDVADQSLEVIGKTIATGNTQVFEYKLDLPSGPHWFEARLSPMLGVFKDTKMVTCIARDITERKKAEEEKLALETRLQQAQKMEAIGTLAGGIAHDFNNILFPIIAYAEMAMMKLPQDSPIQQDLQYIYNAGERAKDLVEQILTFARRREEDRIPLKMSLIVKEAAKFLKSTIPSTVNIKYDCRTEQDVVLADPTQINQIVMNLCTNAAQAMREKGGMLEVILNDEHLDSDEIARFADLTPGHYLRLSIRDTGAGIHPDVIDKIFEPYFTTKDPGEGTGMGLALSHGIVKSYGGDISVESEVEKGTTFHVLLPIVEAKVPLTIDTKTKLPRGNECILLVDDEKVIVDMVQSLLESLGYKVTVQTSSLEALEAFRNKPDKYDLVITDMTMPNMTGRDLAEKLISIRSDIPIILCTGFSDQIDEGRAKGMGISAFIMKPIAVRDIANTVRKVLDKKQ